MKRIGYLSFVVALLASCSTTRTMQTVEQPLHHTAQVKRAMVSLSTDDGQQATVGCTMQTVFDSLCVVSVQPLAGMEVIALYVTPENIVVIDRMHQRYAETTYAVLNSVLQPGMYYKDIERLTAGLTEDGKEQTATGKFTIKRHLQAGKREADLSITYPSVQYDQDITIREKRLNGYKKTDIRTLLKSML